LGKKLSCRQQTVLLRCVLVSAKYNCETILCRHYKSVFDHCDVVGLQSYRIRRNDAK